MNQHEKDDDPHLYAEEATLFHWMDQLCSAFLYEMKATNCTGLIANNTCSGLCNEDLSLPAEGSSRSCSTPSPWIKENNSGLSRASMANTKFTFRRRVHPIESKNDSSPIRSLKWSRSWDENHRMATRNEIKGTDVDYDSDPGFTMLSPSSDFDDDDSAFSDVGGCAFSELDALPSGFSELRIQATQIANREDVIQDRIIAEKILEVSRFSCSFLITAAFCSSNARHPL